MLTFSNADARGVVAKNLGPDAAREVETLDFLPFPELDAAVESDVSLLRSAKVVPESVGISGWVYEVETGKVRRVV